MADGPGSPSDELAQTATATAPGSRPADAVPLVGDQLGRFKLERQIGIGGMGVVHAAFDPDLERRVALKVLRAVDNGEARERLLREARATARVEHPNVVVVYEVGSAGGRDYIAMELVEGETLAKWLEEKRTEREIVDAFVAAGRGLAAAHAKGLVHRDFKPNNVLVRRDRRILVTDFGLARGIERAEVIALGETLPVGTSAATATTATTPSSLSEGITRTGALLGTPAYMAPEQWTAGTVGPAADQFAFCVALWEALAGERPFRGVTLDELKAAVQKGPASADASKIPRRLRRPLLRGLETDPAKRWPTMDALLTSINRAERRPFVAFGIAAGAAIAAGAMIVALKGGSAGAPSCAPPATDPATVWSAELRSGLVGKGLGQVAKVLDDDATSWHAQRDAVCKRAPAARTAALACLDGVLARFDAIRRSIDEQGSAADPDITVSLLADPKICARPETPQLAIQSTPDTAHAFALLADAWLEHSKHPETDAKDFAARPGLDPCARGIALIALSSVTKNGTTKRTAIGEALTATEQCRDDRLRAEALIADVPLESESPMGPRGQEAVEKARAAVDRVPQSDLLAALDLQQLGARIEQRQWDAALQLADQTVTRFAERGNRKGQLRAVMTANDARLQRSLPDDLHAVIAAVEKWRPVADAVRSPNTVRALDRQAALAQFGLGDVKGSHAALVATWRSDVEDPDDPRLPTHAVEGVVVDTAGQPVRGATVHVGRAIVADSIGIRAHGGSDRFTTTDGAGHFSFADAVIDCSVEAELDTRRTQAAPCAEHVKLVLAPTRHIAGKVDLGSLQATEGLVVVAPSGKGRAEIIAPIQPDGSFDIDGVPTTAVQIGYAKHDGAQAVQFDTIPAGSGPRTDVHIQAVKSARTLDVIARSTIGQPLDAAQLFVIPGRKRYALFAELLDDEHVEGMQVDFAHHVSGEPPQTIANKLRAGDLVAHLRAPAGEVSVCVVGVHGDVADPLLSITLNSHVRELKVGCAGAGPNDAAVVVDVPPQKRFD